MMKMYSMSDILIYSSICEYRRSYIELLTFKLVNTLSQLCHTINSQRSMSQLIFFVIRVSKYSSFIQVMGIRSSQLINYIHWTYIYIQQIIYAAKTLKYICDLFQNINLWLNFPNFSKMSLTLKYIKKKN